MADPAEDDDFDFYNPRTWLVQEDEKDDGSSLASLLAANLPKREKTALLLPEKHPKYKVFIDEYRPNDQMQEVENEFSHHIAVAYDYLEKSESPSQPHPSQPSKPSPPVVLLGATEGSPFAAFTDGHGPLNDVYASTPYVVQVERSEQEEGELAERKLEKARERLAKERGKYLVIGSDLATVDPDVLLNALLHPQEVAMPSPPVIVNALGKDAAASVWWQYEELDSVPEEARVVAWEVTRYRCDLGRWVPKGVSYVTEASEVAKCRCEVTDVPNGFMYKFSVAGRNLRGKGFDSKLSEAVLADAELPQGWFRFWDDESQRVYYSNVKTRQTSWTRPDEDPFFLPEDVVLLFTPQELQHLKELFVESEHQYSRISTHLFKSLLLEVGEVLGIRQISDLFFTFSTAGREFISKWETFALIMASIKRKRLRQREIGHCEGCLNWSLCLPCFAWENATCCTRFSFFYLLDGWTEERTEKNKFGDWAMEWSVAAQRHFYLNSTTQERRWDAPAEVRFYVPKRMMAKLQDLFSPAEMDEFRTRFSNFDQDGSGNIDNVEFKMLLEGMGIYVSDRTRRRLIDEIDLNRNGTIEFHEFCFLMMTLNNPKSVWASLNKARKDKEKEREQEREKAKERENEGAGKFSREPRDKQPSYCSKLCTDVISAYHQHHADYKKAVEEWDDWIDWYLLCKRPFGEHGRYCMCGCRKIDPDAVYYCPWRKNEDEPITWSRVCPCCDW
jgi:Ca2+-binding EF-hand superfamily protein